ncbi:hypothetical protein [Bacillus sp. FSL H8-0512]|uniref:hypothetical protein n=1 Tax=Bacillus sp. FSL H8-0512 TaxID=2921395 RepID=UPI0030F5A131
MRERIRRELSRLNMFEVFKGWSDQEQILDELEEGYVGFNGGLEEYLNIKLNY